ncbi:MAG: DNA integrity scanning diadenylate cyclase DisA [Actinobacteria bacterium]|nr:DNA integrity scanning diadenylate cyclase DisA [Actinomycetota bacterium]
MHEPVGDETLRSVLTRIAPGTVIHEGLQRIIRSARGSLIVIGMTPGVEAVASGGFEVNIKTTAQRLSELAKMDGAIILSADGERILRANVHMVPDSSIPTDETGIRHRTAERVARQTRLPVISVSSSMRIVTLYLPSGKRVLEDVSILLFRANQALSTLERYRARLDEGSTSLSALEIAGNVTIRDVVQVLQRGEMVERIAREIRGYLVELGTEGRLVQLQLDELLSQVDDERALAVQDYRADRRRRLEAILEDLAGMATDDLLDVERVGKILGYDGDDLGRSVTPRGYRLLSKIPALPDAVVEKLVRRFHDLQGVLEASLDQLDDVEGVGGARARAIKEGLARLAESSFLDRYGRGRVSRRPAM